ncbi:DUF115 domain-containing protein [Falcatimonas sp. MSJ-15]|uniref:motility associated factor glycosyltransferase family protein n=1 Tax=Falcatimonas sp. MSJ-15 TaxID=2841515 RepID=UPI001C110396|nr:6-hydroxymethylpterin diphosphokinase MptE-like protein [Falcatimonas sp. MSJ-15]MBU5469326.1 DUF115 domain-containing protein [Falcatimonas sp. MSJ-15]
MNELFIANTSVIDSARVIIAAARHQDYRKAMVELTKITRMLLKSSDFILQNIEYYNQYGIIVTEDSYISLIKIITDAQETEDYLYLADILQTELIPLFEKMQDVIKKTEANLYDEYDYMQSNKMHLEVLLESLQTEYSKMDDTDNNESQKILSKIKKVKELLTIIESYKIDNIDYSEYIIQSAINGELTMQMGTTGIHIHSTVNPTAEGRNFAQEYYRIEYNSYIVLGIGLGYHVKELLNMYAPQIIVAESDINMLMLALINMEFEELEDGRLQIIYDKDYTELATYITGERDEKIVIYAPELKNAMKINEQQLSILSDIKSENDISDILKEELLKKKRIYEKIKQIFIRESSVRNNEKRMNLNFKYNIANCTHYVDEIEDRFKGKKVIIVAAGPSLDKNVEQLKTIDRKTDEYVILAVGTVYKKLLNMGIKPDYVIIIEANENIISQISGVEDKEVPLLILSTAYRELARKYQGKKYLIDQYEYDHAEDHAQKYGYKLYSTGGSVTTTATSVAITLGARTIIFIGFDLSYPDGISHADGTLGKKKLDTTGFVGVESIDGTIVYATNVFIIYRNWIENEIKKHHDIEFIDATEGGAKIAGTKIMSLENALKKK